MNTQTSAAGLNLQRASVYADFILCPLGITMLLTCAWMLGPALERTAFVAAFLVGAAGWTLADYLLHRVFLHASQELDTARSGSTSRSPSCIAVN